MWINISYFLIIIYSSVFLDQIIKQIGKGSYGKVYLVLEKADKKSYVLKTIPLTDEKETEAALKEVKILQMFNSPFIVKYHESFRGLIVILY
jgi:serine/threonine protein kinase